MLRKYPNTYCRLRLLFSCFLDFVPVSGSFFVTCCFSRLISSVKKFNFSTSLIEQGEDSYLVQVVEEVYRRHSKVN